MVWLPVFGVVNARTDVDACDSTATIQHWTLSHADIQHAIAHGGCTDTARQSALVVDSERKIPCLTGDSNPRQYCTWLFSRTPRLGISSPVWLYGCHAVVDYTSAIWLYGCHAVVDYTSAIWLYGSHAVLDYTSTIWLYGSHAVLDYTSTIGLYGCLAVLDYDSTGLHQYKRL